MSQKPLSTTITDEYGNHFKGIGLSIKDRCNFTGGHFANWAFWYSSTGSFISSTFMVQICQVG
jgi:hypothetical protein